MRIRSLYCHCDGAYNRIRSATPPPLGVLRILKYNNMKSIFETDEKVQEESKIIRQVKYAIKRKGPGYNKYITFKLLYNNN